MLMWPRKIVFYTILSILISLNLLGASIETIIDASGSMKGYKNEALVNIVSIINEWASGLASSTRVKLLKNGNLNSIRFTPELKLNKMLTGRYSDFSKVVSEVTSSNNDVTFFLTDGLEVGENGNLSRRFLTSLHNIKDKKVWLMVVPVSFNGRYYYERPTFFKTNECSQIEDRLKEEGITSAHITGCNNGVTFYRYTGIRPLLIFIFS